ncbi:helix-turn-helix domain-containing protein [Mycobacteroides abscessus]|uniref:helix-turn-helix domain-containing protein n=1 Tax=Mycobacteroides abscessus TaxID=36809 RepID=UPI0021057F18|nr:helix-turn-helix domain-containing protein [Mycobacteroides abscessus]
MNTTTSNSDQHTLLTLEEARSRLRISLWSLRRLLDEQALPSVNIGRRRFVRSEDIDALIAARAERSTR